jgi:hypothetical protein
MRSMKIIFFYPYPTPSTHPIGWLDDKYQSLSFLEISMWLVDYQQPFIYLIPLISSFSKDDKPLPLVIF